MGEQVVKVKLVSSLEQNKIKKKKDTWIPQTGQ